MLLDIIEEHFDEASFLYEAWKTTSDSILRAELESRLRAHLEAIRESGPCPVEVARSRMPAASPGEQFVSSWALGETEWTAEERQHSSRSPSE